MRAAVAAPSRATRDHRIELLRSGNSCGSGSIRAMNAQRASAPPCQPLGVASKAPSPARLRLTERSVSDFQEELLIARFRGKLHRRMRRKRADPQVINETDGFVRSWRNPRNAIRSSQYLNHSHTSAHWSLLRTERGAGFTPGQSRRNNAAHRERPANGFRRAAGAAQALHDSERRQGLPRSRLGFETTVRLRRAPSRNSCTQAAQAVWLCPPRAARRNLDVLCRSATANLTEQSGGGRADRAD